MKKLYTVKRKYLATFVYDVVAETPEEAGQLAMMMHEEDPNEPVAPFYIGDEIEEGKELRHFNGDGEEFCPISGELVIRDNRCGDRTCSVCGTGEPNTEEPELYCELLVNFGVCDDPYCSICPKED